jgi:glycosyltransferase involved in cell wall biosynthesis
MRVLMFGWEFPPFVAGGLATATLGLVKGLIGCGIDVTLVVPFEENAPVTMPGLRLVHAPDVAQRLGERLALRRIASPLAPYGTAENFLARRAPAGGSGSRTQVYGADLWNEVERFALIAGEVAGDEPHDIIDAHDWITYAAGLQARATSGKPLVAHVHATEFDRSGAGANPAIVERERAGLLGAQHVISNSEVLKRRVVRTYGIDPARVDVIYWGVEGVAASLGGRRIFGPDVPVAAFVGRVTRQKGPRYFLDAARRVADFVPAAKFIVAGDGDELPGVMARAAELGLADRVFFTGGLDRAGVDEVLRIADVCVMPSVSEPFGLVALESLRSGTPCIIPRESGVAEVVRNAFHVDFWDIDEMANQIVALLRYPALHAELRAQGLAELAAPRFGLIEPARHTIRTYHRVLAAAGVDV